MLSAFGRVSGAYLNAWVLTRLCDSRRSAATRSEFAVPESLPSQHWNYPLTLFLGTEDTALSCSPVQDLVKKMLDKNEARL